MASVRCGLSTDSRSQEVMLVGFLATSQAPRASSCAELWGPSFCSALPPKNRASVQVLGCVGTAAPWSIEAIRAVSDQWARYATTNGVRGERHRCGSKCQGTSQLLLEPRLRESSGGWPCGRGARSPVVQCVRARSFLFKTSDTGHGTPSTGSSTV